MHEKQAKQRVKTIKYSMAAMASTEIQIVNIPNLAKIETFLNDTAYRELLENSENYNTRLCIERRLRMPFLDQQTGVAQTNCALFMKRRHRMPGIREGQIYTYPAAKWRKSKRQYLLHHHRPFRMVREPDTDSIPGLDRASFTGDSESKDSHTEPKEWFYDDDVMHDVVDPFEDRGDSDFDYDDNHYKKKRRSRKTPGDLVNRRGRGRGRGRRNNAKGAECETPRSTSKRGGNRQSGIGSSASMPSSSNSPLNTNEDSQTQIVLPNDQTQSTILAANVATPPNGNSVNSAPILTHLGTNAPQEEEDERLRIIRKPNERTKAPPSP